MRDAGRGDVLRPRAVGNLALPLAFDHRRLRRSVLPERGRCSTQGEAARQGGAVSQELSSSRSFLAHWCSPGRLTPRNRSKLPIVYTHIRSATRMVVSRRSWVRRSSATSRGGVPSGVPTRGSWAHTVVYVADRSYSSDRWEPHSRSLTMTRVFTITAALICVCSASLASAQAPANPMTPNPPLHPTCYG